VLKAAKLHLKKLEDRYIDLTDEDGEDDKHVNPKKKSIINCTHTWCCRKCTKSQ
jgi:hypothetical protein